MIAFEFRNFVTHYGLCKPECRNSDTFFVMVFILINQYSKLINEKNK